MRQSVYIVILHYGSVKNTTECLHSVKKMSTKLGEIHTIIVDNASHEPFSSQEVIVLKSNKNLGYAGGNNLGINYALEKGADYVLILNNDTITDQNLIEELLKASSDDSTIGLLSPKIYFEKGYEYHKARYKKEELGKVIWYAGGIMDFKNILGSHRGVDEVDKGQYDEEKEIDFATGCCVLVRSDMFRKAGMLDEKYFLYYEDSDFSQRIKNIGYKVMYVPKAFLWHKNAGAAGGSGSDLQDYYITRNRLLFGMKYAPFKSRILLARESIKLLICGRKWQRYGVIDYYLRNYYRGRYHYNNVE